MTTGENKPFAVFDIDGTVIRWQLYHAVVNQLLKQGDIPREIGDEIHEARMAWKRRTSDDSFQDYETVLVSAYNDALTNLAPASVNQATHIVFEEYKDQVHAYTRNLMQGLRTKGYLLFAISGSPQDIVSRFGEYYGFDEAVGQNFEQKRGKYTGSHTTGFLHKDEVLRELMTKRKVTTEGSVGVGDTEGDAAMLQMVEQPIAFNPTQGLAAIAKAHGWPIVVERKNTIYELEYRNGSYVLA